MTLAARELWRDFTVQRQVVGGIIMRELMGKWGRRNLGFAWLFCVAMIVQVLSERYEIVFHIWPPISYLYLFYAGFLYLADWIPSKWRPIVMAIDPPLHCYEMVRSGLFGYRMHAHYDIPYLTFMLMLLTVFALLLMRDARRHIELE